MPGSTTLPLTLYVRSGANGNGHQGGWRPSARLMVLYALVKSGLGAYAPFTPAQIRSLIRELFGVDLDRRRVHEQLTNLVYKGVLAKMGRASYIMKDPGKLHAGLNKALNGSRKDSVLVAGLQHPSAGCGSCAGRGGTGSWLVESFDGCFVVARWHRRAGRRVSGDPVEALLLLIKSLSLLRGVFEDMLRAAKALAAGMRVSRYRVRRAVGEAQRLLRWLRRRGRVVIGAHGCEGRRCGKRGRFYPFEE